MAQYYKLLHIPKFMCKDIYLLELDDKGEVIKKVIPKRHFIGRMNSYTDVSKSNFYLLINKDAILQEEIVENGRVMNYIFQYNNDNGFVKTLSARTASKNANLMAKLEAYQRKQDMLKRLGTTAVNLGSSNFDAEKISIKVVQGDKSYYCQFVQDHIACTYRMYVIRNNNGDLKLEEIPYNRYFYKYSERRAVTSQHGWVAIPENTVIVVENLSQVEHPSRRGNVYVYNAEGQLEHIYKDKNNFLKKIHKYRKCVCSTTEADWVDFNNSEQGVQIFVQAKDGKDEV